MIRWLDEERKAATRPRSRYCRSVWKQQMQVMQSQATEIEHLRQDLATVENGSSRTDAYPGMIETTQRDLSGTIDGDQGPDSTGEAGIRSVAADRH